MIVSLSHSFLWHCQSPNLLLEDCSKFNAYCNKLEKQADALYPINPNDSEEEIKIKIKAINKYKGDGFELFVEAMIRLFPCDKRLHAIQDYEVITGQDRGIDGHGISGVNDKPITVQCKYRQANYVLTANRDHLSNFTQSSMFYFGVDQKPDASGKCNMIIVSSAESLNFFTDNEMFGNMVHAFCRDAIRSLVDNNLSFWKYFRESWIESLKFLKRPETARIK